MRKTAALLALSIAVFLPVMADAAGKAKETETVAKTAPAPVQPPQIVPYDRDLLRLSEILGSMHYLRGLCNPEEKDRWREKMQRLISMEAGKEPQRKQKLTAAFNRGYRSFAALHASCTSAALEAEERYRAEGATLAAEITARFGN